MGVFVQVADAESLSVAARRLGVTPSAVSKTLTKLEARLGVRLLHRTTRQVALTEDGRAFLERCRRVLREVEEAEAAITRGREAPAGRVRVALPPLVYARLVAPRVSRLLEQHPQLSLDVVLRETRGAQVADVELQVALVRPGDVQPGEAVLLQARQRLVAAPAWLERNAAPRSLEALAGCAQVALQVDRRVQEWRFRRDAVLQPVARVALSSPEAVLRAAVDGLGVALVWEPLAAEELKLGALMPLLEELGAEELALVISSPQSGGAALAPRVAAVQAWLLAALGAPATSAKRAPARGP